MGGVIHASEDGEGMNLGQVMGALVPMVEQSYIQPIQAVTPHGSFTFEIVAVEQEHDKPITLRLKEIGSTRDHWVVVTMDQWHLEHPLSCRELGLEACRITRLVQTGVEAGHLVLGRSKVWLDESGVLLWDDPLPVKT